MSPRVIIIGLGNVLRRDDAFGPEVVCVLESRYRFPDQVTLSDLGTPGLGLASYIAGYDALIIVDSVWAEAQPGTLVRYERQELLVGNQAKPQPRMSPHEPGLRDALRLTEMMGKSPSDVLLIGAVPSDLEQGIGMSHAMRSAVEPACEAVLAELDRMGYVPRKRRAATATGAWWQLR